MQLGQNSYSWMGVRKRVNELSGETLGTVSCEESAGSILGVSYSSHRGTDNDSGCWEDSAMTVT